MTDGEVVAPTAIEVDLPGAGAAGRRPTERLLTLTTCNPKYSAAQRMVVRACSRRRSRRPRASCRPPWRRAPEVYVWFWRHLPGPLPVRLLLAALALAVVVAVLFLVVFPAVEPLLPFTDVTVDPAAVRASPSSPRRLEARPCPARPPRPGATARPRAVSPYAARPWLAQLPRGRPRRLRLPAGAGDPAARRRRGVLPDRRGARLPRHDGHLPRAARAGRRVRERAARAGRDEGRPGRDRPAELPAERHRLLRHAAHRGRRRPAQPAVHRGRAAPPARRLRRHGRRVPGPRPRDGRDGAAADVGAARRGDEPVDCLPARRGCGCGCRSRRPGARGPSWRRRSRRARASCGSPTCSRVPACPPGRCRSTPRTTSRCCSTRAARPGWPGARCSPTTTWSATPT